MPSFSWKYFLSIFLLTTYLFVSLTTSVYSQESQAPDTPPSKTTANSESVNLDQVMGDPGCNYEGITAIGSYLKCTFGSLITIIVNSVGSFSFRKLIGITDAEIQKAQSAQGVNQITYQLDENAIIPSSLNLLSAMSPKNNENISLGSYMATLNPLNAPKVEASAADELGSINVIISLWQYFLNMAYIFMVIVIVALGFMIMFRFNIDPRTVVTVENSIPRVIVALVLMTFSFAVSGLMLDLSRIISDLFLSYGTGSAVTNTLAGSFAIGAAAMIGLASGGFFALPGMPLILMGIILIAFFIITLIFNIIYQIAVRYVQFILMTVLAPLVFAIGAVPNFSALTTGWFKRQAAFLISIGGIFFVLDLAFRFLSSGIELLPSPVATVVTNPAPTTSGAGVIGQAVTGTVYWYNEARNFLITAVFNTFIIGIGLIFYATKIPAIVDEVMGIKELGARAGIAPAGVIAGITGERGLKKGLTSMKGMAKEAGSAIRNAPKLLAGRNRTPWLQSDALKMSNHRRVAAALKGYFGNDYEQFLADNPADSRTLDDAKKIYDEKRGILPDALKMASLRNHGQTYDEMRNATADTNYNNVGWIPGPGQPGVVGRTMGAVGLGGPAPAPAPAANLILQPDDYTGNRGNDPAKPALQDRYGQDVIRMARMIEGQDANNAGYNPNQRSTDEAQRIYRNTNWNYNEALRQARNYQANQRRAQLGRPNF